MTVFWGPGSGGDYVGVCVGDIFTIWVTLTIRTMAVIAASLAMASYAAAALALTADVKAFSVFS